MKNYIKKAKMFLATILTCSPISMANMDATKIEEHSQYQLEQSQANVVSNTIDNNNIKFKNDESSQDVSERTKFGVAVANMATLGISTIWTHENTAKKSMLALGAGAVSVVAGLVSLSATILLSSNHKKLASNLEHYSSKLIGIGGVLMLAGILGTVNNSFETLMGKTRDEKGKRIIK